MRIVREYPKKILEINHAEIPMPDGCRLAARIWMPQDAHSTPVPAVLEYIPYRKNDLYAWRDAIAYPYTAGFGYACVRVDLRGSGESEGVLRGEYLQQELDDGKEVIAWIAAQRWCNGGVGMVGISWGGFNGLQIAALRPPALKAIITCASTDDRYADDVHYMGGCLLTDNLSWASVMFGRQLFCPPDPRLVGERWRRMWQDRLENSGLWLENWLEHQTRDAYWRHGSVCEDYSRIECPVYAIGGWNDGYVNAVFRLLKGLEVPRKGLVGPWSHNYPHTATPGPAIGFLQESLRWWDYWLKGIDTGIMQEPMLRVWIQETAPPRTYYVERPGRWVTETAWPSSNVSLVSLALCADGRLEEAGTLEVPSRLTISSPLHVGLFGGRWCPYGVPGDSPGDQRADDAGSVTFQTPALPHALDILGENVLELDLESDQPVAMIAARLNAIAPDGAATRITYGLLNLTHRNSDEHPEALEPGRRYRVRIPLKHVAETVPAGYRLRVALSTSYWPIAWAAPNPVSLTVLTATSRLLLSVRRTPIDECPPAPFLEPAGAPPLSRETIETPRSDHLAIYDHSRDTYCAEIRAGIGKVRYSDINLTVTANGLERFSIQGNDPSTQRGETKWETCFRRDQWKVSTLTETVLTCDTESFHVRAELKAFENGALTYEQKWERSIPRRLV